MNLTVRDKQVDLKPVDSLRIVYPTSEFESTASLADYESNFGRVVKVWEEPAAAGLPRKDCRIFERAGWRFVDPKAEVAQAAARQEPVANARAAREIYLSDSGTMLVGTSLATVKLSKDLAAADAERILKEDGLTIVHKLGFRPNLYEVRVPSGVPLLETIDKLQKSGKYVWVEPSLLQAIKPKQAVAVASLLSDADFKKQWHHRNTGFSGLFLEGVAGEDLDSIRAWGITRGKGVRVAVIDSGMQINRPDLEGIVGGGFFQADQSGEFPFVPLEPGMTGFPDGDHGTFCLGLVGAKMSGVGHQTNGGCGIAPEADLIAIACPVEHLATQTTLARAIHFAVDPSAFINSAKPEQGADVISCSLDTERPLFSVLVEAVNYAATEGRKGLGVPIFWAVDNEPNPITDDPVCCLDDVIAVGSYDRSGQWAGGAVGPDEADGPHVAFVAPGKKVFSTSNGGGFGEADGTSFATPLAAGIAALVLADDPTLKANQVRNRLIGGCEPMIPSELRTRVGAGKLKAFKALRPN
jgi:subtilisin family serine protease